MRLVVVSIGRLKQGPERELAERYRERFDDIGRKLGFRGLEIHEIPESRARDAATRIAEEAAAISAAIPEKSVLVALDERGDNIDSADFRPASRPLARRSGRPDYFRNRRRGRTFARFAAQGQAAGWRSARRPGRIKWFASCFWNRFIGPRPFWPAIPITARESDRRNDKALTEVRCSDIRRSIRVSTPPVAVSAHRLRIPLSIALLSAGFAGFTPLAAIAQTQTHRRRPPRRRRHPARARRHQAARAGTRSGPRRSKRARPKPRKS